MTDFLDSNLTNKGIKETIKLAFINFQNYLILFLLEFVTNFDGFIAVLYTLGVTIGIKAMIMLGCFFGLDQIDTFLRKLTGSAPKDLYSVTWVDRGFAFLASAWTMGELFTYNPFIVRQYALLGYIDQNFLRGVSYFINLHPLNSTIFSFFVFREVIRRRGPDTKWFGETKKVLDKKYCALSLVFCILFECNYPNLHVWCIQIPYSTRTSNGSTRKYGNCFLQYCSINNFLLWNLCTFRFTMPVTLIPWSLHNSCWKTKK